MRPALLGTLVVIGILAGWGYFSTRPPVAGLDGNDPGVNGESYSSDFLGSTKSHDDNPAYLPPNPFVAARGSAPVRRNPVDPDKAEDTSANTTGPGAELSEAAPPPEPEVLSEAAEEPEVRMVFPTQQEEIHAMLQTRSEGRQPSPTTSVQYSPRAID